MRRMVLSESVKKRERLHAFIRHATAMFKTILRCGALPEYGNPLPKRFHSRISDQLHLDERRRAVRSLARVRELCVTAIGRTTRLAFVTDEEVAGISREPVR